MPLDSTYFLSLISLSTVFWLVMIFLALVLGLFIGGAGRDGGRYDDDSEEIYRDLVSRKFSGRDSEPKIVLISPTEVRKVKKIA